MIIFKHSHRRSKLLKTIKPIKLTYGVWTIKLKKFLFCKQTFIDFLKKCFKFWKKSYNFKIYKVTINTKKSLESRMGGGKGDNLYKIFSFRPGTFLLEYYNLNKYQILYLFKLISWNKKYYFKFLKKKYI
ncbi:putative ribosomal protein L16 (apicoplast) [Toxoplasma gondii TgCatPRC2]|uniref:Ribosomal protein L16 n=13 Tax=Toxoplasma gondii TaxID=5811 RepID=Q9MTE2_TOXGO|nr:ribosomal protein L16 [Toxoplasma gondii RH]AAD41137.1 ribosomal protein L16 [Toxoplasma gondii]EPT24397.1 ribosomal protein L16, putative [Toxoplasma gondii ME49]KFG27522.1 putative ribosomal protein L16 [Toxoplasma gondii p89]KFG27550.1 putative ribosomal protein L16 [Toxoplasma gondii FOU]KFG49807.1 ribosomal protein L16, putative [Toxoplasma gondii RUB]KFG99144.1 putative ribosomal protein L16 [Toxoplasma gondii VAND]KFG99169.1 putative ribosomal protein L16 [Toxoplasma gondii MAS]KY|eukprot:NP_044550.1 ribosomal protein L16 (apicoplast) [Toxoplasma gondii RH]